MTPEAFAQRAGKAYNTLQAPARDWGHVWSKVNTVYPFPWERTPIIGLIPDRARLGHLFLEHYMMKNILLLNGGKAFAHSHGRLNDTLHGVAHELLSHAGFSTRQTKIDSGYDIRAEVENILWADLVIYQMPGWWMGAPWTVKKYIDEVFTAGHGSLYANDGRSRAHPERKYGSGGLLQGKHYMLSLTWNAPEDAFVDPAQFFEGKGVDAVYFPFHKANQFLGMDPLATYLAANVMKEPDVDRTIARYRAHLADVLGLVLPGDGMKK